MMSETAYPENDTAASAGRAGCVVFLIDESTAMDARVADGTQSKARCMATALNSLLGQLATGPELDVAIVGYRGDGRGAADVGCRWGGSLQGQTFVRSDLLAAAPITVENRVRKIPAPDGLGVARRETVPFPVWYLPTLGPPASQAAAYEYCRALLAARRPADKPPLVISLLGELFAKDALPAAVGKVACLPLPGGPPLVFHAHLGSSGRVPPTRYPSTNGHLPPGPIREIFQCSSVLPEPWAARLRQSQVAVNRGARGMIYHAKMLDLIRFLLLVKVYAGEQPPVAVVAASGADPAGLSPTPARAAARPQTAAPTEAAVLIVLLLDRSVGDASGDAEKGTRPRLQRHANEVLQQIAQRGRGTIEVGLVCYGGAAEGRTAVRTGFAGPLAGRTVVAAGELCGGALRVEEVREQVSNGIGGLVTLTRKQPIYVELRPAGAAAATPAFEAVAALVADWCGRHPGSPTAPIVLHLSRGRFDPAELQQAAGRLQQIPAAPRGVLLYHWVLTESPHRSLAYPADPGRIDDPGLLKLWELSSPLLGSRRLAAERPAVAAGARGIVINGRFDLLLDGVLDGTPPGRAAAPATETRANRGR